MNVTLAGNLMSLAHLLRFLNLFSMASLLDCCSLDICWP